MSSQRCIPCYLAIRREAQRKVPAQRGQTIILRRGPFSQPGVDYRARKSALTRRSIVLATVSMAFSPELGQVPAVSGGASR